MRRDLSESDFNKNYYDSSISEESQYASAIKSHQISKSMEKSSGSNDLSPT